MDARLQKQLGEIEAAFRHTRLWRRLTLCWLTAAAVCVLLFVIHALTGWNFSLLWTFSIWAGMWATMYALGRKEAGQPDYGAVVEALERDYPELRPLLSTALEQEPDPETGEFHFLQRRVINAVITHRQQREWKENARRKLRSAIVLQTGALVVFIAMLFVNHIFIDQRTSVPWLSNDVTVSPGDAKVERGTGLVISAKFGGKPPAEATLVLLSASGKTKRIPLERHLADPVFGASLIEVNEDGLYHVEYANAKTRDYKITVFDYPALTRADALLQYPTYTGLTNKTIPDTLRVTAVEGTHLTYTMQLNKPVAHARLVARGGAGSLPLGVQTNALATLDNFVLTNSARYSLELVDAEGRTNKSPTEFVVQVLTNRRPELKLVFPHGDQRVSKLEELQVQAETSDDFGVLKYGIGYGVAGQDPKLIELGGSTRANEKRQFGHLISMEKLGVDVDQVVGYFAWADDYGPDGQMRRTFSDMFFAEVRPFEEIFRADQSGEAESGGQGQSGGGNQNVRLAEMQKQIVIATWKLQSDKPGVPNK